MAARAGLAPGQRVGAAFIRRYGLCMAIEAKAGHFFLKNARMFGSMRIMTGRTPEPERAVDRGLLEGPAVMAAKTEVLHLGDEPFWVPVGDRVRHVGRIDRAVA